MTTHIHQKRLHSTFADNLHVCKQIHNLQQSWVTRVALGQDCADSAILIARSYYPAQTSQFAFYVTLEFQISINEF